MILYLVGREPTSPRWPGSGQTTVDIADGPVQRIQPFVETHRAAGAAGGEKQSPLCELLRGAGKRFRGQIARFRAEKCLLFCMSMEVFCTYRIDCDLVSASTTLIVSVDPETSEPSAMHATTCD